MAVEPTTTARVPKALFRCRRARPRSAGGIALLAALSLLGRTAQAESQASTPASTAADTLSQITVEAQRQEAEKSAHDFVSHAPVLVNSESIARWNKPICPMVAGLPQANGQFILERLSDIAAAVGAAPAPIGCHVNLVIVVAADPVALLKAWAAHVHYQNLFGDEGGSMQVDRFLKTPRAVRVWYNHESSPADGAVQTNDTPLRAGEESLKLPSTRVYDSTRLELTEVWGIASVIELVDSSRIKGFKFGQLADYLAMAALAEFNFDADFGSMPTILRLFNAPSETGISSLSDWDQAYLKALYHTRQSSTLQPGLITQSMVHDINH
jgi:hypothetical protein